MKRILLFGAFIALTVLVLNACKHRPTESPAVIVKDAVTDVDGNTYDAVVIGEQTWMASNLKTTHYADGTEIPLGNIDSSSDSLPYRYLPDNSVGYSELMGQLYNWSAVMHGQGHSSENPSGVQGVCPDGWHVPSNSEWNAMIVAVKADDDFIEYSGSVAKALAAAYGWDSSRVYLSPGREMEINDATGFHALPSGNFIFGSFNDLGQYGYYWTTSRSGEYFAVGRSIGFNTKEPTVNDCSLFYGLSVRCVKD